MFLNKLKRINWRSFLYNTFIGGTPARKLFLFYLYAIIIGMILLSLPISFKVPYEVVLADGETRAYSFIDAFFVTISAFTDTGLCSFVVADSYNVFGQIVIMLLLQAGGVGLFVLYWLFWNMLFNNIIYKKLKGIPLHEKNKIGFTNSMLIFSERGNSKLGLTSTTIKSAIIFIFVTEFIFAIIYSLWFGLVPAYQQVDLASVVNNGNIPSSTWFVNSPNYLTQYHNPGNAIWTGIFHSASIMNNAGFDIIGNASVAPFRNGSGTIIQYFMIIQLIIGGIGYPVFYDVIQWFKFKHQKRKFYFSLFTKVSVITYFIVFLFGFIFMTAFEFGLHDGLISKVNNTPELAGYFGEGANKTWNELTYVIFTTFSSRSAGVSTVPMSEMSDGSKWIILILMFIGCAPSSTGGGIRTTVVAILVMTVVNIMRGDKKVVILKRTIPQNTVITAFMILFVSATLMILFSIITYPLLLSTGYNYNFTDIIFEFSSAYGTVGLSAGVTGTLYGNNESSWFTAIFLCLVMIVGQLGVPTTLLSFRNKNNNKIIEYSEQELKI